MSKLRNAVAAVSLLGAAALTSTAAEAAACVGVTFEGTFASSYSCNSLVPDNVPTRFGGITFLNNNTLLIGGGANEGRGVIQQVGVVRDASNHITGFSGAATDYATAPYIDGGLTFGPGGVLFATGYPNNTLLQFLPGATTPSKTIDLNALGISSSVGTLGFVPTGFAGAGQFKIASYNGGDFFTASLTADGLGTYDLTNIVAGPFTGRGPEGFVYVSGSNAGFTGDSLLLSEYGTGSIGAYLLDANGNPIPGSRSGFLNGLSGTEGAVIDPLTGDFLFSTFGGGNQLVVISGFLAPPTPGVPEPATWAMMLTGFGLTGAALRRNRKAVLLTA